MTIVFTKNRQPFKEEDIVEVADDTAQDYINEGVAKVEDKIKLKQWQKTSTTA